MDLKEWDKRLIKKKRRRNKYGRIPILYKYPDEENKIYLSQIVYQYSHLIILVAILTAVTPGLTFGTEIAANATQGSCAVGAAGAQAKKSIGALALLDALDTTSCTKASSCVQKGTEKVAEQAAKNPKIVPVVVCTAAIVWFTRDVAERIINKHL